MTLFATSSSPSLFVAGGVPAWAASASSRTTVRGATIVRSPRESEHVRAVRWDEHVPMNQPDPVFRRTAPGPDSPRPHAQTMLGAPERRESPVLASQRSLGFAPAPAMATARGARTFVQTGAPPRPYRAPRAQRPPQAPPPPGTRGPGFWDGLWAGSMLQAAPAVGRAYAPQGLAAFSNTWEVPPREAPLRERPPRRGARLLVRAAKTLGKATALGIAALWVPLPTAVLVPLCAFILWFWTR